MNIKFAKTRPDAKIPTKGSELSAGYDLYACIKMIFLSRLTQPLRWELDYQYSHPKDILEQFLLEAGWQPITA